MFSESNNAAASNPAEPTPVPSSTSISASATLIPTSNVADTGPVASHQSPVASPLLLMAVIGLVAGGFAGVVGGAIFSSWVASGDYFPLLAGYGALALPRSTIVILHFSVAVLIGISFGFLFQRDVRGYGSCMGWGLGYATFWWFL